MVDGNADSLEIWWIAHNNKAKIKMAVVQCHLVALPIPWVKQSSPAVFTVCELGVFDKHEIDTDGRNTPVSLTNDLFLTYSFADSYQRRLYNPLRCHH
jgi:hypothetical protein